MPYGDAFPTLCSSIEIIMKRKITNLDILYMESLLLAPPSIYFFSIQEVVFFPYKFVSDSDSLAQVSMYNYKVQSFSHCQLGPDPVCAHYAAGSVGWWARAVKNLTANRSSFGVHRPQRCDARSRDNEVMWPGRLFGDSLHSWYHFLSLYLAISWCAPVANWSASIRICSVASSVLRSFSPRSIAA